MNKNKIIRLKAERRPPMGKEKMPLTVEYREKKLRREAKAIPPL